MSDKLQVEIGAEIKELQSKLKNAESSLSNFGKKADKNLNKFTSSSKRATKGINGLGKGTANAVPAVTEFSRVIQDAPFGIQGVANNITQLTQQFGYLKKSTGSTSSAFKAMLSTLSGPAGILFAVSTITSLWVAYENSQRGATKSTNALVDATKDLVGSAQSELTTLQGLLSISKDENKTKKERQRALSKINELYGDYLPNLSTENLNTKKVTESVDLLSKSLIRQAKIKGLSSRISELYSKRYETETKSITENISTLQSLWVLTKNFGNTQKAAAEGVVVANKNQAESIGDIDKQINKLTESYGKLLSEDVSLEGLFTKTKGSNTENKIRQRVKTIGGVLQDSLVGVQDLVVNNDIGILSGVNKRFDIEALMLEQKMKDFSDNVKQILGSSMVNTFANIGNSIGQALATGGNVIQAVGQSILQGIGGFLSKMGQMMIEYGTMAVLKGKLDLAIAAGGPVAIGAGLAAIAVGVALSAIGGAIGSFASSGGRTTDTSTNAGSSSSGGGASFSAGSSGFGNGTVVFEIAGRKLVGVLRNEFRATGNAGAKLSFS
jgi:hypothetical protein